MIELDANRMNFLQQSRVAFSYRTMLVIFLGWCLLLAAVGGAGVLRQKYAEHEIAQMKVRLEELNAQKGQQLKELEAIDKERLGASVKEDLRVVLSKRPYWSKVLRRLTKSLPAQVWLSSINISKDKGNDYKVVIQGQAKSQRELTNFMLNLEKDNAFRRAELAKTKKLEGVLGYEIISVPNLSKF